ncbi:MAG: type II toxin-antitoxin system HicB family antitoxin [Dehalococcoidia bacterium]
MKDYHINIFWSDEDSAYVADIPDLVTCSALGGTPDEALAQVQIARLAWLEAARAEEKPIPPPAYRPLIYQATG